MFAGFIKGIVIGGIIGASVYAMVDSGMLIDPKTRRRMMRNGAHFMRSIGISR